MKLQIPILPCIPSFNIDFCFISLLLPQRQLSGLIIAMCVRGGHSFEQGQSMVRPQSATEGIDLQHCSAFHLAHGGDFVRWDLWPLH